MKLKKYQIITGVIAIYAFCMAYFFGSDLLKEGKDVRFWVTIGCETLVIILAYFALKKRDEMRERRKREIEKYDTD